MCGVWGFSTKDKNMDKKSAVKIMNQLFLLSESRGKDAAGLACSSCGHLKHIKSNNKASNFIKSKVYNKFIEQVEYNNKKGFMAIGHNRLATNGSTDKEENNQPIICNGFALSHNGVIINTDELLDFLGSTKRKSEIDTEIILNLLLSSKEDKNPIVSGLKNTFEKLIGTASLVGLSPQNGILFGATNNGSLYYYISRDKLTLYFASEKNILVKLIAAIPYLRTEDKHKIKHLSPNRFLIWNQQGEIQVSHGELPLPDNRISVPHKTVNLNKIKYDSQISFEKIASLKRCTKCLLPETMPFIQYDEQGICNYCRFYKKPPHIGENELHKWSEEIRRKKQRILTTFSGGRDSSYSLHYIKKVLGLDTIAFSYDWGVVTDLARRNQSRMCSSLGVEFIVRSADIGTKRRNIKKNISAWLKHPSLGIIPLFMAGDKQYFFLANQTAKENDIDIICLANNPYEQTYFKYGFCNIKPTIFKDTWNKGTELLPAIDIIKMGLYYGKEFLLNPSYINSSLADTCGAAFSNYGISHNYLRLFDYIDWDEKEVDQTLLEKYDWEVSPNSISTWRIGDGTSPFYNYIYLSVCGFTENDCLRSNQIRAGKITREEGMRLINQDNQIHYDEMKWYFDIINLDMNDVLSRIDQIPKKY